MKKLLFLLILPFLVVGCGSGGSSSGSGGACRITDSGLEVCTTLFTPIGGTMTGGMTTQNVDVVPTDCGSEPPEEFTDIGGTVTVTVRDQDLATPLSPQKRIEILRYRVSYSSGFPMIPVRPPFDSTFVVRPGGTQPVPVTILTVTQLGALSSAFFSPLPRPRDEAPFLPPQDYNVRVFLDVEDHTGDSFTISAGGRISIGEFISCTMSP